MAGRGVFEVRREWKWRSESILAPTAPKTRQSVARKVTPHRPAKRWAPLPAHEAWSGRGWEIGALARVMRLDGAQSTRVDQVMDRFTGGGRRDRRSKAALPGRKRPGSQEKSEDKDSTDLLGPKKVGPRKSVARERPLALLALREAVALDAVEGAEQFVRAHGERFGDRVHEGHAA